MFNNLPPTKADPNDFVVRQMLSIARIIRAHEFSPEGEGADCEAIYNLCLVLKSVLLESYHENSCSIILFETAFIYVTDVP
jgi:hypothetical protein